ncbi:MAG: cation:proton antiporter [bacterium]|nr:MAG: cation:proton antiporter [bacterium]
MDIAILSDLAIVFGAAVLIGTLLGRVRLPSEAGFILAGCLIGPNVLALVEDLHRVETMAELGVILLLFSIGMDMPLDRLRLLWKPILIAGTLQEAGTAMAFFAAASVFGFTWQAAALMGLMLAVSSTAVTVRNLEDRGEIDAPHGRLALGILLFQDMCVVPMLLALPFLGGKGADLTGGLAAFAKGAVILMAVMAVSRYLVPAVLERAAQTMRRDLFVLTVSFLCIGTTWLASILGMPLAAGAFISGLLIARSDFRHQALSDVIPFREVFTSLFFISIGMLLDPFEAFRAHSLILSGLGGVLLLKFSIIFLVGVVLRLPLRVSVLAAVILSQVGEFSFVLSRAGEAEGILSGAVTANLTSIVILSMVVTPLLASFGPTLAAGASRIRVLTRLMAVKEPPEEPEKALRDHVIVAGYGVSGRAASSALKRFGIPIVVLDLNPDNVRQAVMEGHLAYFGDVTSTTVLRAVGIHRARVLVIVVNDPEAAARAIRAARNLDEDVQIVVRGRYLGTAPLLQMAGATTVVSAELEASVEVTSHLLRMYEVPEQEIARQREIMRI